MFFLHPTGNFTKLKLLLKVRCYVFEVVEHKIESVSEGEKSIRPNWDRSELISHLGCRNKIKQKGLTR